MVNDFTEMDFFRGSELIADPYPYYEALRQQCPVTRENHHDVTMVTGWDEACAVFNDAETWSSCISVTGPFPGFPVPLEGGDDITELIEQHRDELPFSDQLPTLDPPTHTNHRSLLMRLITPKRLKENEDAMWVLADQALDGFLAPGHGEFIKGFAEPVHAAGHRRPAGRAHGGSRQVRQRHPRALGWRRRGHRQGIAGAQSAGISLRSLLRLCSGPPREPRDDVLTGLATATYPDGSTPEVEDVARVASNVFSAGQETTVRLLGAALQTMGERPDIQAQLRKDRSLIPNFIEESLRIESPVKGDFRMNRVPVNVGGVDLPAGTTVMIVQAAANRDPRRFEDPTTFDPARKNARQHISFGRGIHSCPGAPLARAETRVAIERLLDRTSDIRINERVHGPANDRRYQYVPTYILRGLTELHLEFTPA